jgi:4-aminobutyrate aminotransferase / (S)-3-amino-2-methylpropionate transaminase / 5-aminovalerate transaminase
MTTTSDRATAIRLVTEIPGPKSAAILARREAATPNGNAKLTPISIESAHGALVTDVDGNTFIDMAGGIGVLAVGHTPQTVVDAIKEQTDKLIHMSAIVSTYEPMVEAAEMLNRLAPGDFAKKTVFMNTGAEAVETAVHIARSYTKRQGIVVFDGGYHGRTNMTMAMTSKFNLFKKGFGPFAPEIYRFPVPQRVPPSCRAHRGPVRRVAGRQPVPLLHGDRRSESRRRHRGRAGAGRGWVRSCSGRLAAKAS